MCGISISRRASSLSEIQHRGIEMNQVEAHGFYLGHSRLPIQTELGDVFSQPLELKDGGYLLYNGEIFNCPKKYTSDVEYLLDLFNSENIGDILEEANKWDGFWAIVHVTPNGFMYCFTDPLGKKQLYYNEKREICSEIRPLVHESCFDPQFKSCVYKWGYNTDDRTPWSTVKRILPNKLYVFVSGQILKVGPYEYYDWEKYQPKKDLKELIYDAVRTRLITKKYPIGSLVSGGLDSAILASVLEDIGAKVNYYSIENNEGRYANLLAQKLGIEIKCLLDDYSDSEIEEAFRWNETPIDLGSVLPQHRLMSVIPDKIVLTGDGADELFGGYRRINTYDSQRSDIFEELPFYHLPRLDRASMRYTIELRSPFLSHDIVKYALSLPYNRKQRVNKRILKDLFRNDLPKEILDREKVPLKSEGLRRNPEAHKNKIFDMFYNKIFKL